MCSNVLYNQNNCLQTYSTRSSRALRLQPHKQAPTTAYCSARCTFYYTLSSYHVGVPDQPTELATAYYVPGVHMYVCTTQRHHAPMSLAHLTVDILLVCNSTTEDICTCVVAVNSETIQQAVNMSIVNGTRTRRA